MNPKTVVILVVVLVIACAVLVLPFNQKLEDATDNDTLKDKQIIPDVIFNASLNRLRLKNGLDTVELVKNKGRWWVQQPHLFPANTAEIDRLLSTLQEIKGTNIDNTNGEEHESPSIDMSRTVLIDSGSSHIHIYLWNRLGAGRAHIGIAGLSDDNILHSYNADDQLHDFLKNLNTQDYLASSIEPLLMPDVQQIEITADNRTSVLQQEQGRWLIARDDHVEQALEQGLNGYTAVADYFRLLQAIKIDKHKRYGRKYDNLKRFGLYSPLISARFVMKNDEVEWLLRVGVPADPEDQSRFMTFAHADDRYPAVFTVPTPVALAFAQDATVFRDPRLFTTPSRLIKAIALTSYSSPNQSPTMIEIDRMLFFAQRLSQPATLDPTKIATMLRKLQQTRAIDYVTLDELEAERIEEISIIPRLDGEPETLEILTDPDSTPDQPTVLIRRGNEHIALRVSRVAVAGLLDPMSLVAEEGE